MAIKLFRIPSLSVTNRFIISRVRKYSLQETIVGDISAVSEAAFGTGRFTLFRFLVDHRSPAGRRTNLQDCQWIRPHSRRFKTLFLRDVLCCFLACWMERSAFLHRLDKDNVNIDCILWQCQMLRRWRRFLLQLRSKQASHNCWNLVTEKLREIWGLLRNVPQESSTQIECCLIFAACNVILCAIQVAIALKISSLSLGILCGE